MYYIITDNEIKVFETLEELNATEKVIIEDIEMHSLGKDYIAKLSNKDIDFVRDKYNLSKIPLQRLFNVPSFNYRKEPKKIENKKLVTELCCFCTFLLGIVLGVFI